MWVIRAVLIAILLIAVVGFAYYNFNPAKTVDIDLIYTQYINVPLVTVVFWAFVAGVLVSLILFVSTYIKMSVQLRNTQKNILSLESEIAVLRNRPIEESAKFIKENKNSDKSIKSPFESGE